MNTETITWNRDDDLSELRHLLSRAVAAKVRVTFAFGLDDWASYHEAVPELTSEGWRIWVGQFIEVAVRRPHHELATVTATLPPERPEWLPEGAEDGDWLADKTCDQCPVTCLKRANDLPAGDECGGAA